MAVYYVDSNASGANDGTSWTDAFSDLATCLNDVGITWADHDEIWVASNHSHTQNGNISYSFPGVILYIVSVNSSTDAYARGATEDTGSALLYDVQIDGGSDSNMSVYIHGMDLLTEDEFDFVGFATRLTFVDCNFTSRTTGSGFIFDLNGDGDTINLIDSTFTFSAASNSVLVSGGSGGGTIIFDNSTLTNAGAGTGIHFYDSQGAGNSFLQARNTDFTGIDGALVSDFSVADDNMWIQFQHLKYSSDVLDTNTNILYEAKVAQSGSADQFFNYNYIDGTTGESAIDTTTYLNGTYDGSTGFSYALDTTADASPFNPLRVLIGEFCDQDLSGGTTTVTVEATSDASLTDLDLWIEVESTENADEVLLDKQTTRNSNIVGSGSALTTAGTGTWTSGDTEDYIMTVTVAQKANVATGKIYVYSCVGKPSINTNFDVPVLS
jgi:hypothetical protein